MKGYGKFIGNCDRYLPDVEMIGFLYLFDNCREEPDKKC